MTEHKKHRPQWAVIDPEQNWDYDRVCGLFWEKVEAEKDAQQIASGWKRPIMVAEIIGVFYPQESDGSKS